MHDTMKVSVPVSQFEIDSNVIDGNIHISPCSVVVRALKVILQADFDWTNSTCEKGSSFSAKPLAK